MIQTICIFFRSFCTSKAYEWLKNVDKSQILQLNTFTFVVPSTNANMNTNTRVSLLYSMDWQTYDQFKDWLSSARILDYSQMLPPIFCSCKCGLKEYYCVHTTGLMMMWGVRKIPLLIGKRRNKGRIKKAKYALSKDWFSLKYYSCEHWYCIMNIFANLCNFTSIKFDCLKLTKLFYNVLLADL